MSIHMANLILDPQSSITQVAAAVEKFLKEAGFSLSSHDLSRPWGGFFVLEEAEIRTFKQTFFPNVHLSEEQFSQKLSPKFLLVAPGARLSWQYHFRRAELWNLVAGDAAICRSLDDSQGEANPLLAGEVVSLAQGERHRLIGTSTWGVVAEIWMHSDPGFPSDESDIVLLQDDYARN
jgi:mannose-6-phosphate isomerase-like protein (cupin superfamily)